jgi:WD40 repeat protein
LQEKDGPAAFTRDGGWGYRIDSGGPQPSAKPAVSFAFYDMAQPKLPPRHVQSPVAAFSAFALSPDGSRFAIAGDDPFGRNAMVRFMASGRKGAPAPVASDLAPEIPIHVLDVATGKEVRRLSGHVHQPVTLMFDRTGHMLLSASLLEKTVRLWDVEQGKELRQFGGHEAGVRRAELSPDGRWIVSGDEKGVIKTWATQAAEPVDIFHFGRGHPVWAFHGALLAMLTDDKGVGVWDLSTRQWTANLGDPGRRIEALEFIDDGKRLTSLDRDGLTVWSIDPPESIISIPAEAWLATDLPRINATLQTLKPDR